MNKEMRIKTVENSKTPLKHIMQFLFMRHKFDVMTEVMTEWNSKRRFRTQKKQVIETVLKHI